VVGSRPGFGSGIALSFKLRGEKRVVAAGYGDGAANQGLIHEVMNMAAIWKLPILFYCENNQYAVTTSAKYSTAIKQLSARAAAYGFERKTIDGMDVITIYNEAKNAIEKIRSGKGPYLLECIVIPVPWPLGRRASLFLHKLQVKRRDRLLEIKGPTESISG